MTLWTNTFPWRWSSTLLLFAVLVASIDQTSKMAAVRLLPPESILFGGARLSVLV
jgi:hypothetical protein